MVKIGRHAPSNRNKARANNPHRQSRRAPASCSPPPDNWLPDLTQTDWNPGSGAAQRLADLLKDSEGFTGTCEKPWEGAPPNADGICWTAADDGYPNCQYIALKASTGLDVYTGPDEASTCTLNNGGQQPTISHVYVCGCDDVDDDVVDDDVVDDDVVDDDVVDDDVVDDDVVDDDVVDDDVVDDDVVDDDDDTGKCSDSTDFTFYVPVDVKTTAEVKCHQ
eukprot:254730_1